MINIFVLGINMEKKNIARNVRTGGNASMNIMMRGINMNPYNCRRCEYITEQLGIKYCLKVKRAIDTKTIDYVGCVSHSDFQNQRDKLIDDIIEIVATLVPLSYYYEVQKKIEELRGEMG
jgi:hypothetical protein